MQKLFDLLMIREEERPQALYYLLLFLLIGAGLALGRGTMDALFLKRYGIQYLPVMYAVLSVFLAVISLTYAAWVDRIASERFFVILLAFLAVLIAGSWALMAFTPYDSVYPLYFLVYELASELLLLHGALYLSQNFDTLQLQRLSAPIFAGAQAGMIAGGLFLGAAATHVGVRNLLLVWAVLVGAAMVLIIRHHRRAGISPYFCPGRKGRGGLRRSVEQLGQGLRFLRTSELFRMSSFALFFMVIAFFILCYSINRVYTQTFTTAEELGAFFGWLTAATGASALLIQLLVTSKLLRRFGVRRVNFIFPAAGVVSYLALLVSFTLPAAIIGSFTKDVLLPAIRRPARNLFLNALPDYMQGRVRALSVALVLPLALLVVSGFLILTQRLHEPAYFLLGGLCAVVLFAYFKLRVNRAYTAALLATLREKLFLPPSQVQSLGAADRDALIAELRRGLESPDPDICVPYARLLVEAASDRAPALIAARLQSADYALRDRLLRLLIASDAPIVEILHEALRDADDRLRASILGALFDRRDARAAVHVPECLSADNPRLIAVGILGVERYGREDLRPAAQQAWNKLLVGPAEGEITAGTELLSHLPDARLAQHAARLLAHPSPRVHHAILEAMGPLPFGSMPELAPALQQIQESGEWPMRQLAVRAARVLDADTRRTLCIETLGDPHPAVVEAAIDLLAGTEGRKQTAQLLIDTIMQNKSAPRVQQAALGALPRYQPTREIFERIAAVKTEQAELLATAHHALRRDAVSAPGDSPRALLRIVLRERVKQAVDLALLAMNNFEDPQTIATIRAGLSSGERRYTAHACETLRNAVSKTLAGRLGALLEDTGHDQPGAKTAAGTALRGVTDVIEWCRQHGDPWLRACAASAASLTVAPGS